MDDTVLLIANILSLIGNVIATSAAILKSKRKVLLFQSSNHVLEIVAQGITAAYSGMVQEVISLIRNLLFVFVKSTKKAPKLIISILCLVAGLVLGVVFNVLLSGNVWYGYLPVAGGAIYAVFVILAFLRDADETHSELTLKIGLLFNAATWSAYGVFVRLYPVIAFNAVAFVLAAISVVRAVVNGRKTLLSSTAAPETPESPAPSEEAPPDGE